MRFQQQLAINVRDLHRIVDQPHFGAYRHERKERGYVLRVHADATVSDGHSDCHGVVSTVKHVAAATYGESHGIVAEWIVRPGWYNFRQRIAVRQMLFANRLRRVPGGV